MKKSNFIDNIGLSKRNDPYVSRSLRIVLHLDVVSSNLRLSLLTKSTGNLLAKDESRIGMG